MQDIIAIAQAELAQQLGEIAYQAAAAVTGCAQPWADANQVKWIAAGQAVIEAAAESLRADALGCCPEDAAVCEANADAVLRFAGLLPPLD